MSVRLSVTLVSCAQTAGRIEMLFGTEVGLGQCHIVLDGYPHPPREGAISVEEGSAHCDVRMGKLNDPETKAFLTVRRRSSFNSIFAARCYASAAYVVMRCLSVCPSHRVSVTFVDHVKTNKHIIKSFPPSGSHAILVFPCQTA